MRQSANLLILVACAALPKASAVPIVYTLTGYIQASGAGEQVNVGFTWTVNADTNGIANPSPGMYQNPALSSSITLNGVTTNQGLANIVVTLNTSTGQVTFRTLGAGGIGLTSSSLTSYNLANGIGPLDGPNVLVAGNITTSSGTVIAITGVAPSFSNPPSPAFTAAFPSPTVTNVENAASNIPQGLPNAAIAQGSIFILKGSDLGPQNIAIAPSGQIFQSTTVGGTSISVQVGSTTVNALMYYSSATQVAALLPSNTPVGNGMISVAYNNDDVVSIGTGFPITVVANNVGVFSQDSSGQGPGIVTYADYSLVSSNKIAGCGGPYTNCGAANAGDTLILWATGLGPVNGSDAAGAGLGVAIDVPLTLWLGGVKASVGYQGRSGCCIGEDQIVFTVPNNVPTGCAVPLVLQVGSGANTIVSNATVMPIAPAGTRNCTPSNPAAAAQNLAGQNLEQAVLNGPLTFGTITMSRISGTGGTVDQAVLQFEKILSYTPGLQPSFVSFVDDAPSGQCVVYSNLSPSNNPPIASSTPANAGTSVRFSGPAGNVSGQIGPGGGTVILDPNGEYLYEGSYTVSNGSGGADVGPFNAMLSIPGLPQLTSPSQSGNNPPVTRASGLTVTWNANNQGGVIVITLSSATDDTYANGSTVVCRAPTSAGALTIPGYDLLALPAGEFANLTYQQATPETPFTATSLGFGEIQNISFPSGVYLTLQ